MHWPYTLDFNECYLAAQWGAALLLTAALFFWRLGTATRVTLLLGIWLSAVALFVPGSLEHLYPEVKGNGRAGISPDGLSASTGA